MPKKLNCLFSLQVPVDSLNKLMENKEELIKVLERHIVPGVRMEGKEVPDGQTKLKSASGDELSTDRDNFVKVKFCLRTRVECYNLKGSL